LKRPHDPPVRLPEGSRARWEWDLCDDESVHLSDLPNELNLPPDRIRVAVAQGDREEGPVVVPDEDHPGHQADLLDDLVLRGREVYVEPDRQFPRPEKVRVHDRPPVLDEAGSVVSFDAIPDRFLVDPDSSRDRFVRLSELGVYRSCRLALKQLFQNLDVDGVQLPPVAVSVLSRKGVSETLHKDGDVAIPLKETGRRSDWLRLDEVEGTRRAPHGCEIETCSP